MKLIRCLCALLLCLCGSAASAARHHVVLDELPSDTEWLGWNASGEYLLQLPGGWEYAQARERPTRVLLAGGGVVDLSGDYSLQAVGSLPVRVRTNGVRGRLSRGRLVVTLQADRFDFGPGAEFESREPAFGETRRAQVASIATPNAPPLEIVYDASFMASFDRVQYESGDGAALAEVGLPALATADTPERVTSLGLWAPKGVQLVWGPGLRLECVDAAWCRLNGRLLRTQPPLLQAPRGEVWVRRSTLRRQARVVLPCRLQDQSGMLAEDLTLLATGAPGVVRFSARDTHAGLQQALAAIGRSQARLEGHEGESRLVAAVREYLLPLWHGLWYDAETGREELRQSVSLSTFASEYAGKVRQSRPLLQNWLATYAGKCPGDLAAPDQMSLGLRSLVDHLSRADRREGVWWSIYLSDLLSGLTGGAVYYGPADGTLVALGGEPAQGSLAGLRDYLEDHESTPLLEGLRAARAAAGAVDTVQFDRLDASSELPLNVVVEVGRAVPLGRYETAVELRAEGAEPATVPLVVHVQPSYGDLALRTLAVALPLGLVLLLVVVYLGRQHQHEESAHLRRVARLRQTRQHAWRRFTVDFAAVLNGQPERAERALQVFAEWGLHEALTPELYEAYLAARQAPRERGPAFFQRARHYFQPPAGGARHA